MVYQNLSELLSRSSSTRKYFISLPVMMQMLLHKEHNDINTAAKLRWTVDVLKSQEFLR